MIAFLLFPITARAQEEQVEEKKFEWTPDLDWEPPAELLAGIEKIGELNTHLKSLQISYPEIIKVFGDKLYVFDVEIEKLLLFDAAGNFQRSLFADDQRISNHISCMNIDDKGRVLLSDMRTFFIFDKGEISSFENIHRLGIVAWDGEKILGLNQRMDEREEGLIKEVTLEGEVLDTWGEAYFKDVFGRIGSLVSLRNVEDKLYLSDAFFDGFVVLNPMEKSQTRVRFDIPAWQSRIALTKESFEIMRNTKSGRARMFPVFYDLDILAGEIYLLLGDRNFFTVVVSNEDGRITRVYRGLKPEDSSAWRLAVSTVEGRPRFFFSTGGRKGDKYHRRVDIYAPCEKVPTLAYIEEREKKQTEEEKLADEKRESERKIYDAFREADSLARQASSEEEKRSHYYSFAERHPNNLASAYALTSAAGRDPSAEVANEILQHLNSALAKATEENVRLEYMLLRTRLCATTGQAEEVGKTAREVLEFNLKLYHIITVTKAAAEVGDWQLLLESSEKAIDLTELDKIKESVGGMTGKRMLEMQRHFKSLFLTARGRALTNLDRIDEALTDLEAAAEITERHYTGNYINEVDLRWAEALSKNREYDKAIETLIPGALFSGSEEKVNALREIFAASGRTEDFDPWLWKERIQRARRIDDAVFYDYEKNPVKLSSKLGKATLLTFWTPST